MVRFLMRLRGLGRAYSLTMPALRKLDAVAVEQIVAWKGAGQSDRRIAATLGVSHSTVSRRIRSDPELRVRIHAAKKREARRARDRERKARAKARREPGLGPGSRSEPEQRSRARPSPAGEQALGERGTQVAGETARSEAAPVSRTRPHGRRDELRVARRIILDLTASFEARQAARETLLELLEAKRSNGRPAYSLSLAAAKALRDDPARIAAYRPLPGRRRSLN